MKLNQLRKMLESVESKITEAFNKMLESSTVDDVR